jgi:EAL domain-containing protein (putative c-di-GMP-specific phosphodiesterase class I)/FixJ family two-component response regulator
MNDINQLTILIIDDEPFVLRVTAQQIKNLGFECVLTAESAEQALLIIEQSGSDIDLVISDLNMPDVDGVELLRRFNDANYQGDIILFSGEDEKTLSMAESLARARKLSVLGSTGKPLDPDRFLELLKNSPSLPKVSAARQKREPVTSGMIENAIEQGDIVPWFQPKIDIANRTPVGVEALARWPGSARGPVYPDEFIPVAEKSGLIDRLTFLMLEKSVQAGKLWRAQGIDLKIALNVSMESLHNIDLPDQLYQIIIDQGENPDRYQLEVTESQLMEDLITPLEVLLRLRMKKISLSIDDFGTGHSNLSQLRDLPFDELKLDRSYVQASGDNGRGYAILESSLEMARKLNLVTVAEGVETLEEWSLIEALGCDQVQGYLTARPMPAENIADWFSAWPKLCEQIFV